MKNKKKQYEHYIKYGVYEDDFNLEHLSKSEKEEYKKNHFYSLPKLNTLQILHYLTFGISTFLWYGLQYSKLPKIQEDDFDSIKGIGFMFIPIFSFYWMFIFWDRLIIRLDFQMKLRNKPEVKNKLKFMNKKITLLIPVFGILSIIPVVNIVTGLLLYFILLPTLLKETYQIIKILSKENLEKIK